MRRALARPHDGNCMARSPTLAPPPAGFRYLADFIDASAEARLLAEIERLVFEPVVFRGVRAKREVVHYGARYVYASRAVGLAPPLPDFLLAVAQRAAAIGGFAPDASIEALVTRYPPGAGIGWHRDAPVFGPVLAGLSLGAACELRLRYRLPEGWAVFRQPLAPRSLYVLAGEVRASWEHMIPPVERLRYSVTFRTIRKA